MGSLWPIRDEQRRSTAARVRQLEVFGTSAAVNVTYPSLYTLIISMCACDDGAQMEKGYKVWTFDGKGDGLFVNSSVMVLEQLYQAFWRPRPPSLLSKEQVQQIRGQLREKYWKKFELEDEKIRAGMAAVLIIVCATVHAH